ncbi:unnamed protein product [Pieris macdunnoughi]|uniref:Regulatory protein zeste n=1 Tax=Pieris macdunnoughi TaxID=345717 RepID=A0A821TRT3_9NEOP|nr:unnamed protein product [Pieris macdunnoughi]
MEERKRKRNLYVTPTQKKKLIELLSKHPMLLSGKRTQNFTNMDAQRVWQSIAKECNSIPGSKKHWRQWKKSWQDMRSKYFKRNSVKVNDGPSIKTLITKLEEECLSTSKNDEDFTETTEFVMLDESQEIYHDENLSHESISEPASPQEEKVFAIESQPTETKSNHKSKYKNNDHDCEPTGCNINCDILLSNEKRKIKLKEDFINFKKDYFRQKLKLLKEQTEALKSIAKEICNK